MVLFGEKEGTPAPGVGGDPDTLDELGEKYQELKQYIEEIEKLIEELLEESRQ
jgi:hypothetical protein